MSHSNTNDAYIPNIEQPSNYYKQNTIKRFGNTNNIFFPEYLRIKTIPKNETEDLKDTYGLENNDNMIQINTKNNKISINNAKRNENNNRNYVAYNLSNGSKGNAIIVQLDCDNKPSQSTYDNIKNSIITGTAYKDPVPPSEPSNCFVFMAIVLSLILLVRIVIKISVEGYTM